MPTPLNKQIEGFLKTVIEAQLTEDSYNTFVSVIKGHDNDDKDQTDEDDNDHLEMPYIVINCDSTPKDPEMPASTFCYRAIIELFIVWDVFAVAELNKSEADIDNYLESAACAVRDVAAIQTETQANYPGVHVHAVLFSDTLTYREGENIKYDGWEYEVVLEEIDPP